MKLLLWILLIVASTATELQHDSICKVAFAEDTAQVTCIFSKDVYQEKVTFSVTIVAANSDDPNTVAACIWEAEDSLKPDCKLFSGIHLNKNITNVVAITVPVFRLPAGGGRFMCQMAIQDGNDFLPCSWTDPEAQTTTPPGISNTSASTGEQSERTDSHYWSLAIGAHIFGTVVVTVLLYSLILIILWHKGYLQRWLNWIPMRREKTNTAESTENAEPQMSLKHKRRREYTNPEDNLMEMV